MRVARVVACASSSSVFDAELDRRVGVLQARGEPVDGAAKLLGTVGLPSVR